MGNDKGRRLIACVGCAPIPTRGVTESLATDAPRHVLVPVLSTHGPLRSQRRKGIRVFIYFSLPSKDILWVEYSTVSHLTGESIRLLCVPYR